jgi:glycosyltransferase involved in cell wall biosynthesis
MYRWYGFVKMQARVARRIPTLLGVSTVSAQDAIDDFKLGNEQFNVVPLGVDTDLYAPTRERVPNRIVVVASADKPLKGLRYFLDAAAKVRTEIDIDVQLVSNLDPEGRTVRRIAKGDLAGAVTVHSGISDEELADLIASAQVMAIPSLYEGFSLPAVEGLACGTPLVASAAGALPETVGDAGVLVTPRDVEALATEMKRFLTDSDHWVDYSARGRQRALDKYSWVAVARSTVEVYQKEIARWAAAASKGTHHVDR